MSLQKLTKEQLEKVLRAHDEGRLVRTGQTNFGPAGDIRPYCGQYGCINQIVYDVGACSIAADMNPEIATWFDWNYDRDWTRAEFEAELRSRGFVEE